MRIYIEDIRKVLDNQGIKYHIQGCDNIYIDDFCSLNNIKDYAITWVKKPDTISSEIFAGNCQNIIVSSKYIETDIKSCSFIITEEPKKIFFLILDYFWNQKKEIDIKTNSTVLSHIIGENVKIGWNCYIGEQVEIGKNVIIENNVVIQNRVRIGDNCIIHSGAVIGSDGYGYYYDENRAPYKVTHFGGVVIENEVEIGANACIDRGTIDDTYIKKNAKIDNLCHIAHNVIIGENVMVIAGSIICGSVTVNDRAYVAPGTIIKNQTNIGEDSLIGMGSLVLKDTVPNRVYIGSPAKDIRERGNERL